MIIHGHTEAGSLRNSYTSGDVSAEKLVGIVLIKLIYYLQGKEQSGIIHSNENSGDIKLTVIICLDSVDGNSKL